MTKRQLLRTSVSYKVTGLKPSTSYKLRITVYMRSGSTKLYGLYATKNIENTKIEQC